MNIINHGKWIVYTPVPFPEDKPLQVLFCKRETDNVDWYDFIYRDEVATPTHYENGLPVFPKGPASKKVVREALNMPDVKCQALFQEAYNSYVIGTAVFDITKLFPANQLALEITDYTGTDPQADFGGKAYDPATNTISTAMLYTYRLPRSLIVERINAAGKFNQLKAYLNSHAYESELWYGSSDIGPTEPLILSILTSIGADPPTIMAPE